jgi:hypothetical protein
MRSTARVVDGASSFPFLSQFQHLLPMQNDTNDGHDGTMQVEGVVVGASLAGGESHVVQKHTTRCPLLIFALQRGIR